MDVDVTSLMTKLTAIQTLLQADARLVRPQPSHLGYSDNLPALFFRVFPDGQRDVEFLNSIVDTFTGYTTEELVHREIVSLHPLLLQQDREAVRERIAHAIDENASYEVEYRILHKDKKIRYFVELGKPHLNAKGKPSFIEGLIIDVTERKTRQMASMHTCGMEATATLAAGIAQDLNNLMVGVLGNSFFLKTEYQDNPASLEIINEIIDAGKRASVLIYQLLAHARIGRVEEKLLDLNEIISELIQLQHYMLPAAINLEYRPQFLPGKVLGDLNQFSQVLMNLLCNAIESIEGSGKITIATQPVTINPPEAEIYPGLTPGKYAKVSISDTGQGMSPELQTKIFEPFFTTKFPGRGLGLAAATSIIKNHRGHICVDSKQDRGSVFTFYLPLKDPLACEDGLNEPQLTTGWASPR